MRVRRLFLALALVLPAGGCNLLQLGVRNLRLGAVRCADDFRERCLYRQMAPEARGKWGSDAGVGGGGYRGGVTDGFADYLDAGGNGEPPLLPPPRYRMCDRKLDPEAVGRWRSGFRHGALAARQTGYRERAIVAVAVAP